jgi:porin
VSTVRVSLLAAVGLTFAAGTAAAQATDQPKPEHLISGWSDGPAADGIDLGLEYKAEIAGNVSGGRRRMADYSHLVIGTADVDAGKLWGLQGLKLHAALVNVAGNSLSTDALGDNLLAVQDAFVPDVTVGVRLAWLYAEQSLWDDRINLAAGRLPVHRDYARSGFYCRFMSTAICGGPHTLPAQVSFTDLPFATWGARVQVKLPAGFSAQGGAYEVNPQHGGPSGFNWSTSRSTGTLYPVELTFQPGGETANLPGNYKLGWMYDTSSYPDLFESQFGGPIAVTGGPGREHRGRPTGYAVFDQMLARHGKGPTNGLTLFGGFVATDARTFKLAQLSFLGLSDEGPFAARPKDVAGLLVAHTEVSHELTHTEELQQALAEPLTGGVDGIQRTEWVVEANYAFHVRDGLSVMPDLQWVRWPGAVRQHGDAVVLGARLDVKF